VCVRAQSSDLRSTERLLVGEQLDLLLDRLARERLGIGPRERMLTSALVAELLASGQVKSFGELRPWLAPLLVRSADDMVAFDQVFDLASPGTAAPKVEPHVVEPPRRTVAPRAHSWWRLAAIFCLLTATALVGWWQHRSSDPGPTLPQFKPAASSEPASTGSIATTARAAPPPVSAIDTLNRVAKAADRFESAPTLDELAGELALASTVGWPAASYAVRLNELSGLPRAWPLALYGRDAKDGRIWAMVALALERVERPGREPTFAAMLDAANAALAKPTEGATSRRVYELAAKLPAWLTDPTEPGRGPLMDAIQRRWHKEKVGGDAAPMPGQRLDTHTIQRALAIADDTRVRRVLSHPSWAPHLPWIPLAPTRTVSPWVAWLAALVPLVFAVLWLADSVTLRKAYLRRRPPDIPPQHLDIVARAGTHARFSAATFQRVARRLRARTARPTDRLNLEASIAATIAGGGEMPSAVYEVTRQTPEYLVLIERQGSGDQDAERLRDLIRRLEEQLSITVLYYRTEPALLERETGGRYLTIEQVQAVYPEHRLLILGSGAEFLDAATRKPLASVEKLTHWSRRALLTPLPLAEWASEEFELAHALKLPIGRATPEGLETLAELLALDGTEPDTLLDARGDGRARPLPEILRVRSQRFLYTSPPADLPVAQLIRHLRNMLDGPSFDWLAALAVYPAVQWDLTLYLGVMLPERSDGDPSRAPLYREDRVAALTQLPWLRAGIMPNWLRSALIHELEPTRADSVRALLRRLIDAATESSRQHADDAIKLRIARDKLADPLAGELLEDEVLLDFLARGRIEDFALPGAGWLERFLPRGLLERIGLPALMASLVAGLYSVAAWGLAPRPGNGAVATGAWLPLLVLCAGGLGVLTLTYRETAYRWSRSGLFRISPIALAIGALLLVDLIVTIGRLVQDGADLSQHVDAAPFPIRSKFLFVQLAGAIPVQLNPGLWALYDYFLALAALPVFLGTRWLSGRVGIPVKSGGRLIKQILSLLLGAGVIALTTLFLIGLNLHFSRLGGGYLTRAVILASACAGLFLAAWFAARRLPERLAPPKPVRASSSEVWHQGLARAALALMPIVPAVVVGSLVHDASYLLAPTLGGVTAAAEIPGGKLMAYGGADGLVHVYDLSGARPVLRVSVDATSPVAGVALRAVSDGDAASPVILAVTTSDGHLKMFDGRDGKARSLPTALTGLQGVGSRVHVALLAGARPLIALEAADGEMRLASAGGTTNIDGSGPVTALTVLDGATPDRIALATLDGRVRFAKLDGSAAPVVSASAVATSSESTPVTIPRLPGRVRALHDQVSPSAVVALGDDGTVMNVTLDGDLPESVMVDATLRDRLGLGRPVPWRHRRPNIIVMTDDEHDDMLPRSGAVMERLYAAITAELTSLGYAVIEEARVGRDTAPRYAPVELYALARQFKTPPADVVVVIEAHASVLPATGDALAVALRMGGRVFHIQSGEVLGNSEAKRSATVSRQSCTDVTRCLAAAGPAPFDTARALAHSLSETTATNYDPDVVAPRPVSATPYAVVVLGSGVDYDDPRLRGAILEKNAGCFSATYPSMKLESLCPTSKHGGPAGRNCSTDILGCDSGTTSALAISAWDSTASGSGNPQVGVAPEIKLVPIQVFSKSTDENACRKQQSCVIAPTSNVVQALDYVRELVERREEAIAAVLVPFGNTEPLACDGGSIYARPIEALTKLGVAVVVSAANSAAGGAIGSPACAPNAIAVTAVTADGTLARYASFSDKIEFAALGESFGQNGNSFAAARVAGLIAQLKSREPQLTIDQIKQRLASSAKSRVRDPTTGLERPILGLDETTPASSPPSVPPAASPSPKDSERSSTFEEAAEQIVRWAYEDCRPSSPPARSRGVTAGALLVPRIVNAGFHTSTPISEAAQQRLIVRIEQALSLAKLSDGRGVLVRNPSEAGLSTDYIHGIFSSARGNDTARALEAAQVDFILRASADYAKGGSVLSLHFLLDSPGGGCQKRTLDIEIPQSQIETSDTSRAAPPSAAPSPPPAPSPKANDWDVVPVYYGTDRRAISDKKRVTYGAERARRLETGRALVTIPKAHQLSGIERPSQLKVPFLETIVYQQAEDPAKHFTIRETVLASDLKPMVGPRLAESKRYAKQGLLFVHGYNVSFDLALFTAARIAYDLKFDGAPFIFSWPSSAGVMSYTYDRESAEQSEPYLREFIETTIAQSGVETLSIIAHGMGNQPLLRVLRDIALSSSRKIAISEVILVTPDVDREGFENIARSIKGLGRGLTLYVSSNDPAIAAARSFWGMARAGDVPSAGPIIVDGIDTIDATVTSTDISALNSPHAASVTLLQDIELLLRTGVRPPERRSPLLQRVAAPNGAYWRFQNR
jgi:esterase/lipase superfamily enzyme